MARLVTAIEGSRATLIAQVVDEERTLAAGGDQDAAAAKQKHKELVRAAGRAALEESLHGNKRKAAEMTAEGIATQWQAYAAVYGTNGMAAGGGRSSEEPAEPAAQLVDAPQQRIDQVVLPAAAAADEQEPERTSCGAADGAAADAAAAAERISLQQTIEEIQGEVASSDFSRAVLLPQLGVQLSALPDQIKQSPSQKPAEVPTEQLEVEPVPPASRGLGIWDF